MDSEGKGGGLESSKKLTTFKRVWRDQLSAGTVCPAEFPRYEIRQHPAHDVFAARKWRCVVPSEAEDVSW